MCMGSTRKDTHGQGSTHPDSTGSDSTMTLTIGTGSTRTVTRGSGLTDMVSTALTWLLSVTTTTVASSTKPNKTISLFLTSSATIDSTIVSSDTTERATTRLDSTFGVSTTSAATITTSDRSTCFVNTGPIFSSQTWQQRNFRRYIASAIRWHSYRYGGTTVSGHLTTRTNQSSSDALKIGIGSTVSMRNTKEQKILWPRTKSLLQYHQKTGGAHFLFTKIHIVSIMSVHCTFLMNIIVECVRNMIEMVRYLCINLVVIRFEFWKFINIFQFQKFKFLIDTIGMVWWQDHRSTYYFAPRQNAETVF